MSLLSYDGFHLTETLFDVQEAYVDIVCTPTVGKMRGKDQRGKENVHYPVAPALSNA